MHPSSIFLTVPLFGDMFPFLQVMGALTGLSLLMHYPHYFTSKIMWSYCIVKSYRTTTSFLMASFILQINITTIWHTMSVPHGVR